MNVTTHSGSTSAAGKGCATLFLGVFLLAGLVFTAADTREFSFQAPNGPYSFSGTPIALIWAIEFVAKTGSEFERIEITIAPEGREIVLPRIPQPKLPGLQMQPAQ